MCAVSSIPVNYRNASGRIWEVRIEGLAGGHSGTEIDKNRGNANTLMGRLLYTLKKEIPFEIASLTGGQKDNVIPRECTCELVIQKRGRRGVQGVPGASFRRILEKNMQDRRKALRSERDSWRRRGPVSCIR